MDLRGKSDPFVVLYKKLDPVKSQQSSECWTKVGQTETVYNNLNPKWSNTFNLEYHFGTNTVLRFDVYDRDSPLDDLSKHDYIGEARCTVAQVVLADNQTLHLPIRLPSKARANRGTLTIRGEEQKGDLGDAVTLQFSAFNLRKAKRPFYVLSRQNPSDSSFSPVVYSEVHQNYAAGNTENIFRPVNRSLTRLVNGDLDRLLKIEFLNFRPWGDYGTCGSATFTLRTARLAATDPMSHKIELKKQRKNGQVVTAGTLIIKKCDISAPYSFIDYIQSGVVINTVIAVDMSSSNGDPQHPTSLQYNDPANPNEYVIALRAVGDVLAAYDTSKTFPAFGFGAALPPHYEEAAHVFALTGDISRPVCNGVEDVIRSYYNALGRVAPFEPCKYGPMLEHVIRSAKGENGQDGKIVYTILLIVTDGEFSDFADVANLICSAADLPLSIVIVGVGNSSFKMLDKLDGDSEQLCSSDGTPCARDIVQFVPFHKHRYSTHQLAAEVLEEIPEQFLSYMRSRSIRPKDIKPAGVVRRNSKGPYYPNGNGPTPLPPALPTSLPTALPTSLATSVETAMMNVPTSLGAMSNPLQWSVGGGAPFQPRSSRRPSVGPYSFIHRGYTPQQRMYMPGQGAVPSQAMGTPGTVSHYSQSYAPGVALHMAPSTFSPGGYPPQTPLRQTGSFHHGYPSTGYDLYQRQ